jgi:hypothetical protein
MPYLFLRGHFEHISFSSILYTVASPFGMVKPGRGWSAVGIWLGRSVSWEGAYSVRYINNNNNKSI